MGAPGTWDWFAPTVEKKKLWMLMMHLDRLTPSQGAARDELP
jgi:hypothetical protein